MQITVLGKSPAWQDAGGACSGYLVEHEGTTVLLDCGNGVFAKLRSFVDYVEVSGVVISHMHADHCLDLIPYAYALTYAPRQQPVPVGGHPGTNAPARPTLHLPPAGTQTLRVLGGLWGSERLVEDAFRSEEYNPDGSVQVGSLCFHFREVPHYVPTFAISVTPVDGDGPRLVFSADCSPNDELVDFARDADLLLIESTLPRPERSGVRGHLTCEEAGDHGRRAGAKRLVLTHISDELDVDDAAAGAADTFGAPVEVASDGAVFEI
ncbi:MAG TPA: MBL fold metallo-hydrolase [Solirubrobacteraceae bacterium]|nr:MBL fold metallo-hydrolase [Solirubrobacteraceae bacterium]